MYYNAYPLSNPYSPMQVPIAPGVSTDQSGFLLHPMGSDINSISISHQQHYQAQSQGVPSVFENTINSTMHPQKNKEKYKTSSSPASDSSKKWGNSQISSVAKFNAFGALKIILESEDRKTQIKTAQQLKQYFCQIEKSNDVYYSVEQYLPSIINLMGDDNSIKEWEFYMEKSKSNQESHQEALMQLIISIFRHNIPRAIDWLSQFIALQYSLQEPKRIFLEIFCMVSSYRLYLDVIDQLRATTKSFTIMAHESILSTEIYSDADTCLTCLLKFWRLRLDNAEDECAVLNIVQGFIKLLNVTEYAQDLIIIEWPAHIIRRFQPHFVDIADTLVGWMMTLSGNGCETSFSLIVDTLHIMGTPLWSGNSVFTSRILHSLGNDLKACDIQRLKMSDYAKKINAVVLCLLTILDRVPDIAIQPIQPNKTTPLDDLLIFFSQTLSQTTLYSFYTITVVNARLHSLLKFADEHIHSVSIVQYINFIVTQTSALCTRSDNSILKLENLIGAVASNIQQLLRLNRCAYDHSQIAILMSRNNILLILPPFLELCNSSNEKLTEHFMHIWLAMLQAGHNESFYIFCNSLLSFLEDDHNDPSLYKLLLFMTNCFSIFENFQKTNFPATKVSLSSEIENSNISNRLLSVMQRFIDSGVRPSVTSIVILQVSISWFLAMNAVETNCCASVGRGIASFISKYFFWSDNRSDSKDLPFIIKSLNFLKTIFDDKCMKFTENDTELFCFLIQSLTKLAYDENLVIRSTFASTLISLIGTVISIPTESNLLEELLITYITPVAADLLLDPNLEIQQMIYSYVFARKAHSFHLSIIHNKDNYHASTSREKISTFWDKNVEFLSGLEFKLFISTLSNVEATASEIIPLCKWVASHGLGTLSFVCGYRLLLVQMCQMQAKWCVEQQLKTHFGGPKATFLCLEKLVSNYRNSDTGEFCGLQSLSHYTLLLFLEALELEISKAIYTLNSCSSDVQTFYRTNFKVCEDWLNHMRSILNEMFISIRFFSGTCFNPNGYAGLILGMNVEGLFPHNSEVVAQSLLLKYNRLKAINESHEKLSKLQSQLDQALFMLCESYCAQLKTSMIKGLADIIVVHNNMCSWIIFLQLRSELHHEQALEWVDALLQKHIWNKKPNEIYANIFLDLQWSLTSFFGVMRHYILSCLAIFETKRLISTLTNGIDVFVAVSTKSVPYSVQDNEYINIHNELNLWRQHLAMAAEWEKAMSETPFSSDMLKSWDWIDRKVNNDNESLHELQVLSIYRVSNYQRLLSVVEKVPYQTLRFTLHENQSMGNQSILPQLEILQLARKTQNYKFASRLISSISTWKRLNDENYHLLCNCVDFRVKLEELALPTLSTGKKIDQYVIILNPTYLSEFQDAIHKDKNCLACGSDRSHLIQKSLAMFAKFLKSYTTSNDIHIAIPIELKGLVDWCLRWKYEKNSPTPKISRLSHVIEILLEQAAKLYASSSKTQLKYSNWLYMEYKASKSLDRETTIKYQRLSAEAYGKFLGTGTNLDTTINSKTENYHSNTEIDVVLRLFYLLVTHGGDDKVLQNIFNKIVRDEPVTPWLNILPQVIARIDHVSNDVAHIIDEILRKIVNVSPHSIIYPCLANLRKSGCSTKSKSILQSLLAQCESTIETNNVVSSTKLFTIELDRIAVLWDEAWLQLLSRISLDISRRKSTLQREAARISSNQRLTLGEKADLAIRKIIAIIRPLILGMQHLYQETVGSASVRGSLTSHELQFLNEFGNPLKLALQNGNDCINMQTSTKNVTRNRKSFNISEFWTPFENIYQSLQRRAGNKQDVELKNVSPLMIEIQSNQVVLPTFSTDSRKRMVDRVDTVIEVLNTKTRPKKLHILDTVGNSWTYLLKAKEDLRLDDRVMQILNLVNRWLMSRNSKSLRAVDQELKPRAQIYAVIPLGDDSGLIQMVPNVVTLFKVHSSRSNVNGGGNVNVYAANLDEDSNSRPTAPFFAKLIAHGVADASPSNRKNWDLSILRKVLVELQHESRVVRAGGAIAQELQCHSTDFSDLFIKQQHFRTSVAVMSILGYVLGVGDRHLDNILLSLQTGHIVHIDYNVCFDRGKQLKVPEVVPFRLTQMIMDGLGISGVKGTFETVCQVTLDLLRNSSSKESITLILQSFVYDPLSEWRDNSKHTYANMKRRMEMNINLSLFYSRAEEGRYDMEWFRSCFNELSTTISNTLANLIHDKRWSLFATVCQEVDSLCEKQETVEVEIKSIQSKIIFDQQRVHELGSQLSENKESKARVTNKIVLFLDECKSKHQQVNVWRKGLIEFNSDVFVPTNQADVSELCLQFINQLNAKTKSNQEYQRIEALVQEIQNLCHNLAEGLLLLDSEFEHTKSNIIPALSLYKTYCQAIDQSNTDCNNVYSHLWHYTSRWVEAIQCGIYPAQNHFVNNTKTVNMMSPFLQPNICSCCEQSDSNIDRGTKYSHLNTLLQNVQCSIVKVTNFEHGKIFKLAVGPIILSYLKKLNSMASPSDCILMSNMCLRTHNAFQLLLQIYSTIKLLLKVASMQINEIIMASSAEVLLASQHVETSIQIFQVGQERITVLTKLLASIDTLTNCIWFLGLPNRDCPFYPTLLQILTAIKTPEDLRALNKLCLWIKSTDYSSTNSPLQLLLQSTLGKANTASIFQILVCSSDLCDLFANLEMLQNSITAARKVLGKSNERIGDTSPTTYISWSVISWLKTLGSENSTSNNPVESYSQLLYDLISDLMIPATKEFLFQFLYEESGVLHTQSSKHIENIEKLDDLLTSIAGDINDNMDNPDSNKYLDHLQLFVSNLANMTELQCRLDWLDKHKRFRYNGVAGLNLPKKEAANAVVLVTSTSSQLLNLTKRSSEVESVISRLSEVVARYLTESGVNDNDPLVNDLFQGISAQAYNVLHNIKQMVDLAQGVVILESSSFPSSSGIEIEAIQLSQNLLGEYAKLLQEEVMISSELNSHTSNHHSNDMKLKNLCTSRLHNQERLGNLNEVIEELMENGNSCAKWLEVHKNLESPIKRILELCMSFNKHVTDIDVSPTKQMLHPNRQYKEKVGGASSFEVDDEGSSITSFSFFENNRLLRILYKSIATCHQSMKASFDNLEQLLLSHESLSQSLSLLICKTVQPICEAYIERVRLLDQTTNVLSAATNDAKDSGTNILDRKYPLSSFMSQDMLQLRSLAQFQIGLHSREAFSSNNLAVGDDHGNILQACNVLLNKCLDIFTEIKIITSNLSTDGALYDENPNSQCLSIDGNVVENNEVPNQFGLEVIKRVEEKLNGVCSVSKVGVQSQSLSVIDQTNYLIKEATSIDNLCVMYEGWTPWI